MYALYFSRECRPDAKAGPRAPRGRGEALGKVRPRAALGRLRLIGKKDLLVDTIYVDNAADAHLLALDKLTPESSLAGKSYFLSINDKYIYLKQPGES